MLPISLKLLFLRGYAWEADGVCPTERVGRAGALVCSKLRTGYFRGTRVAREKCAALHVLGGVEYIATTPAAYRPGAARSRPLALLF